MKINLSKRLHGFLPVTLVLIASLTMGFTPTNKKVKDIIKSMTLEQKAQLVIGTGMQFFLPDSLMGTMPDGIGGNLPEDQYGQMINKIRQYVPGAAGNTAEFPEIGITTQVLADGPAGLRISPTRNGSDQTYYCTAFPISTVMASTWDTDLVEKVGKAMGSEVLEYGADIILGPALNLQRDPLCGRNFEYYSEDPLITGKMAAAMVRGIQSNGVGTSIKHFAVNNQETMRMSADAVVSERALRELYLKGFEIAIKEGKPWTVMSSYNKINGTYASESHDLLTKILRNDWGFEGYVMTDWGGGSDVAVQMIAGNDLIMPGSPNQVKELMNAVESGKLDKDILDVNVERILNIMLLSPRYKGKKNSNKPDLKAHAEVTRQAATDGMVLLKNTNDALPVNTSIKKVAAFGNASYEFISGGTGSGDVNEAYTISLIQGLENSGFVPNDVLKETYTKYIQEARKNQEQSTNFLTALMGGMVPVAEMPVTKEQAESMAATADVALITIGRNAGEGEDRKPEEGDFYLSSTEKDMIKTVTDAFHAKNKKAIVILNVAGVVETASWSNIPDAVLCAWQPGQEGGNSVVDVLTGKVNPSGKLAVSFPVKYDDVPSSKSFPGKRIQGVADNTADMSGFSMMQRTPWESDYEEDIYVGYRYYNTFEVPVAYEFGYGLSYTTFEFSNLKVDTKEFDGRLNVSVEVKNTGKVAGREVVQLYASKPDGKLKKPADELIAFTKTGLLKPGKSETLKFTIQTKDLSSFDATTSSWIAEAGTYSIKVGASSKDIKLQEDFNIGNAMIAEKVSKALVPQKEFNKLTK